jgi:D-alanine-D-alanine ligase
MQERRRLKLGILFGGKSGEHEVSLSSAASVIEALDPAEFDVTAIGITKDGRLASLSELERMIPAPLLGRVRLSDSLMGRGCPTRLISGLSAMGPPPSDSRPEIIFPLLHGPYGEDGTIQGLLEIAGIPYIGCGVLASAVGMDKAVMKRLFLQAGLPTVPHMVVATRELDGRFESIRRAVEVEYGYPVFTKPANLGSSVGVCKVHAANELQAAVRCSAAYDRRILIEKGIDAREIECAVLGNDEPQASTVGEILPGREFYDYEAKYVDPASRLEIPAGIPASQVEEIRHLAIRAFQAIDGAGLARVDFFLDRGSGKVFLNEINTMPGFTPISMYSKLWAASGVPFVDLIRRLVELGFQRHEERSRQSIS